MKKNILFSSMAPSCPFLSRPFIVSIGMMVGIIILSLFNNNTAYPQALKIGDQLPDITVEHVMHHANSEINLADYKGKLIIIDFWATWCAPCISMLPKIDSLQQVFQNEVLFLPVTYEPRQKVEKLLTRTEKLRGITLPIATNDQQLHALFPHKELPHYVWVNKEGIVIAITGSEEVTAQNIRSMLLGEQLTLTEKKDVLLSYNREQPLLFANLGITQEQLHFQSLFSSYVPGLPSRYDVIPNPAGGIARITAINATLEMLYQLAWSNGTQYLGRNRIRYEVKDPTPIITKEKGKAQINAWMEKYTRSYELILPNNLSSRAFEIMQRDLSLLFPQYKVSLEKRKVTCLALIRTSAKDKIKTTGQSSTFSFSHFDVTMINCSLELLIAQLNGIYLQDLPTPIINATNYTSQVDMVLDANLTNVESIRKALQAYDLDLVTQQKEIEMLIIQDANEQKKVSKDK